MAQQNPENETVISFEDSLAILDKHLETRSLQTETLPILKAHGRTLSQNVCSKLDLPPFNKSAMDGFAIIATDIRDQYTVIENVPAGKVPTKPLTPGNATRIMTGAATPENAGKVIMHEQTDNGNDIVKVFKHSDKTNICIKGEDVRTGDPIFEKGQKISAIDIANIVACGITEVQVYTQPKIAIIATGDEIVDDPASLSPGQIMNSNGPLLEYLAIENHLAVTTRQIAPDNKAQLTQAINDAAKNSDLIILTGGVSAGDYDYTEPALKDANFSIHYNRVSVQPGKPLTFATGQNTVALGLPGNPVSVLNGFFLYALRVVAKLTDANTQNLTFQLPLKETFTRKKAARTAFIPCKITPDGKADLISYHGSGHLLALSKADGFIKIPLNQKHIPANTPLKFYAAKLQTAK